ncbi:MAG: hypothetical protein JNK90_30375 [Planctomycetaceae bacterium]|nr:hypothetical protein [Planctomycetaceae bacterium]
MKRMIAWITGKTWEKTSIDRLPIDDLRRRSILLRNEEKKLQSEIETTEKAKETLFEQGSSKEISDRQRRQAAMKIADLDLRLKDLDRNWNRICKDQKIVDGLIRIKTEKKYQTVRNFLPDVDPQDVRNWIEENLVSLQLEDEKADQIIGLFDQEPPIESNHLMGEAQTEIYLQLCSHSESTFCAPVGEQFGDENSSDQRVQHHRSIHSERP